MIINEKFNYKIDFDGDRKVITGRDLSDNNNLPCFFTRKKRGIEKAFDELKIKYQEMKFFDVMSFLDEKKLSVNFYYEMD